MTSPSIDKKRQKVTPRKAPKQARAKEKVRQILQAASELLASDGLDKLTNNHIAKAAGMSVGSLYQYFPNKQAIIYSLYQEWLSGVVVAMKAGVERASEVEFTTLMDELTAAIYGSLDEPATSSRLEVELIKAMALYPELQEIDRQHGESMGLLFADIFLAAGLTCDEATARQLGLYFYSLDAARVEFLRLGGEPALVRDWSRQSLERLLEPYLL